MDEYVIVVVHPTCALVVLLPCLFVASCACAMLRPALPPRTLVVEGAAV